VPRPPKPLTPEEQEVLRKFVEYDHKQDCLVWRARQPEDFGTKEPERTAHGFNRAKAGKPIGMNAVNAFAITTWARRYPFTENKVRAFFAAPHKQIERYETSVLTPNARTLRHPHARGSAAMNTNPDGNMFDKGFIRAVMGVGVDKVLRWKPLRAAEDKDMLEKAVRERLPGSEYEPGEIVTWRSMRMYNSRVAGTEVKVTTAGVVRLLRVILFSPFLLEQLFPGARIGVTEPAKRAKPAMTDDDIRAVLVPDRQYGIAWAERTKATWFRLVMLGAEKAVPSDEKILAWNNVYAGTPPSVVSRPNRASVVRIGSRTIGIGRAHAALR